MDSEAVAALQGIESSKTLAAKKFHEWGAGV
jgi:hypothetical protein